MCGARDEAGTVGDEVEAVATSKVVAYVRKYIFIYTQAGTVGDNEVEAIAAVKRSCTDVIYIYRYTDYILFYIDIST